MIFWILVLNIYVYNNYFLDTIKLSVENQTLGNFHTNRLRTIFERAIHMNPEYSLEGLILKLKLQYSDHLMRRANSLEKTLMLGKIEGRRRRGWQRTRWLDGITKSMDMSWRVSGSLGVSEVQRNLVCCGPTVAKSWAWVSDWRATIQNSFDLWGFPGVSEWGICL